MPLNVFGDTVEQEVNAFGDPVEAHPGEIQKLNHTELAKLPQFQPEQVSMLDKIAGPISDYVVAPIANIPNAIRGVAAEGMNLPFRAARAMGLYPESQLRMQISPDQFDANGNVVPGNISQSNVPVPLPYNANYAPQISFSPTPMQPTQPEGQALLNKVLGMATPDVALGAPLVGPRATAAFFAPQMVAQVPQMVQHGAEQVMNPALSGREKVGAAGNTLADLLMAAAVTHGAMPETPQPSGLTRADVPGYMWEDVRRFQMPDKPAIQLPDAEQPKTFETPIVGQRPLDVGQKIVTSENTPSTVIPQTSAIKPEPLGGQISFNSPANANAIPNALQQAQPSLAQMLEDAIKRNQIEREQNASQIRSNQKSLPGTPGQEGQTQIQQGTSGALRSGDLQQTAEAGTSGNGTGLRVPSGGREGIDDLTRSEEGGKTYEGQTGKTSTPTTSDFEKYSELRQQAKEFSAKGEFPPSELLRQMEEIKNRNKGMPPKEETTVPLNERLQARLKAFNDAQAKRIQSGDSMGRIDAGLLDDVVNIGRLAYGSAKDFASWSGEMVKKLGEHVKPHLQEVWDNVKRAYDTRPTNTAMVMQAGELVSQPAKLRLGLDKDGKYDAGQAVARLRNTLGESSAEWQVLKETGIQERFKPGQKVTPEELRGWVDENGPKVEVRKFGEQHVDPSFQEFTQLRHELDTAHIDFTQYGDGSWEVTMPNELDRIRNISKVPEQWRAKIARFVELSADNLRNPQEVSNKAHWSSIAPKAEKDMPGYVELAVVKPRKQVASRQSTTGKTLTRADGGTIQEAPQFPSSHSFPPNTLAFARGYMETTKDGKKVFHVIEVQSDWAQRARAEKEFLEHRPGAQPWGSKPVGQDPLLAHYERLALKAAIEHAKKEGASAIAVSDAETAMMTEGHDRTVRIPTDTYSDLESQRRLGQITINQYHEALERLRQGLKPEQEPGMRLHYDRTLPKIVEELTGQKGGRVEFGEHQSAYDRNTQLGGNEGENPFGRPVIGEKVTPRKDLIFRNQDNTPKTSISAKMFDLSKVSDEPKTLFGKDRPSEVNVEKTKEALAPKTGGIGTGMKKAIEGNQEAGSVSLEPFKDFAENTKKIAQGLGVDFQVMRDMFLRKAEFRHIVAKNMGIEGGATTTANRARNSVELEATRIFGKDKSDLALNGVTAALSAEGDKNKLALFATQAAKNKEAIEGIRFAQANWNKLQPLVKQLADIDTFNRSEAAKSGVSIPYLHDYLKRMYESDRGWLTRGTGSSGMGAGSKLPRQFDTVYHAIQFGKKPILDAAQMIGKRTGEIFNEVNEHLWSEHLKSFPDSRTGEMVMAEPVRKGKMLTAPEGYTNVQLPSGKTISVLEGYDKLVKAITGESLVNNSIALSALRNFGQEMKHGTLAFDTYHMSKVMMFESSLGLKPGSHKKGLSILEYSNSDLNEALKQGLITQKAVDYSRGTENTGYGAISRREIVSLGIRNGLGVGKHSEALYDSFARSIPGIGQAHKFIFDKLTRGAMAEAFVKEFTRQSKNHATMGKDQVAQMVARDLNFRLGNIGKQGIFKSATMQDLLSIPFLAPKWVEAIAQSEGRSIGQIGKAMLPGKDFMKPGTLGKSSAALVMTFVAATQVLNMLSTGHPTWKNEKGHQLDLFVPPITKGGKGLWISPLSVAAELTHDMVRLTNNKGNAPDATARIAVNKLSGTGRGLYTYITGKNWKGEELHGWDRVEAAIGAMFNPLPLPLKQTTESIKAHDYTPGERQGFAMIGVKSEPESYNEQKQRIIDNMKSGKSMTLFERKQLEEQLKSLRQTPSDAAKVAITTRATEQMLERKNGLRDELPDDIKSWLKHENLDITGFDNAFSYRKTRIGLTQDEADRYKEIVQDAYVQFLSAHVGQQMTQQKLDGVLIKAKNYARKQMKGEMQQ